MNMKRYIFLWSVLLLGGLFSHFSFAQENEYYSVTELPNGVYYLPAPPDTSDMLIAADIDRWIWGKSLRPTPRGAQASEESLCNTQGMANVFSQAIGVTLSREGTPAIWKLMRCAARTGDNSVTSTKKYYMRVRPFARLNEHVASKYDNEDGLRRNGSYPSGHTAIGWSTALALAEMLPELQDTILRRGFEFGESRVIVGAHWQSDVDAGRLASSVAYARMHRHPNYARDLAAARAEYLKLNPSITSTSAGYPDGSRILDKPVNLETFFLYGDMAAHWKANAKRNTERGRQAVRDADNSIEAMLIGLSKAAGKKMSVTATPHTAALLAWARNTLLSEAGRMKKTSFRERPYVRLNEPSLIPEEEAADAQTSSFPSAAATLGWGLSLVLTEIAPDHSEEILKYGYEYGESRVIAGYQFTSDVQAGRILAACIFCRMHNDPAFRDLLDKAQKEWTK